MRSLWVRGHLARGQSPPSPRRVFTLCKTAKNKCYGFSHDIAEFRCLNNT